MGLFKKFLAKMGLVKEKVHIICCGLDNSGKTTVINYLKPKKARTEEVVPTIGYSIEEFKKNNISFTVFDMSGAGRYRSLWEQYYRDVQAIIFVIDTNDSMRMCVAKDELDMLLKNSDVSGAPVLFLANKMDLPNSLSPEECVAKLELQKIADRNWNIFPTNALSGEGVEEAIRWLSTEVSS